MRRKQSELLDPMFGGYPYDPAYDIYMKKCMRKYPYIFKMIDYIVDCKIAALRAEMYQMGMMSPGMMYPGMQCPGMAGPAGGMPYRPGYPMMPM